MSKTEKPVRVREAYEPKSDGEIVINDKPEPKPEPVKEPTDGE